MRNVLALVHTCINHCQPALTLPSREIELVTNQNKNIFLFAVTTQEGATRQQIDILFQINPLEIISL